MYTHTTSDHHLWFSLQFFTTKHKYIFRKEKHNDTNAYGVFIHLVSKLIKMFWEFVNLFSFIYRQSDKTAYK